MALDRGPRAFPSPERFRAWLIKNHDKASELVVRCYKVGAASRGVTYTQALDEALCFGWIDGVRHALDAESFTVRFSPRKPGSAWSRVNIARANALIRAGRMAAPGLARFRARSESQAAPYYVEYAALQLPAPMEKRFRAEKEAWAYFQAQPPWYRRTAAFWVMDAKREETRARRLATLIECSARGKWIPGLKRA